MPIIDIFYGYARGGVGVKYYGKLTSSGIEDFYFFIFLSITN